MYCKGSVTGLPEEAELFLVNDRGKKKISWSKMGSQLGEIDLEIPWGQGDWQWTRLEIRDPVGKFLAYLQPGVPGRTSFRMQDLWGSRRRAGGSSSRKECVK